MKIWIIDPKTSEPSVSLTMLCASFVAVLAIMVLHTMGKIETTSVSTELFYANAALYFGRRFSIKGKEYGAEKSEETKE